MRAAVQWVRSHGAELNIDPSRIALIGESSGTQLAALVALAGDSTEYANAYRDDPYASVSTKVKAVVGVYGVYDLMAQWEHDLISQSNRQWHADPHGLSANAGSPRMVRRLTDCLCHVRQQ